MGRSRIAGNSHELTMCPFGHVEECQVDTAMRRVEVPGRAPALIGTV